MNNLLFRADGNAQIGLGHVMRCLGLADMLNGLFSMRFALIEPTPAVRALIEGAGLSVVSLPESAQQAAFLDQIQPDEIVILDGYSFDELFQRSVRSRAKKLAFIDDLLTGRQVADVVINHAGGVTESDYDAESYTQFCLGPQYALLRPEFLRPRRSESQAWPGRISAMVRHSGAVDAPSVDASEDFTLPPSDGPIFVSLGGADLKNTSLTVLEAIRQADATLPVHLVLGPFHPNRAAIEAFQTHLPNLILLQNLNAAQMVNELEQCWLAITACSTIAYEVCAVNRPFIAIVTADNQDRLAQFLSEEKLALSVNFPTLLTRLTPIISLETLLKLAIQGFQFSPERADETLTNQRRFFDGRSPERFRALFQTLSSGN